MEQVQLHIERLPTPIGLALLAFDDGDCLRALEWQEHADRLQRSLRLHYGVDGSTLPQSDATSPAARKLDAYFAGELGAIDDIAVATGGTPFQRKVWRALRQIPVGKTTSYGALARRIGHASAVRAVGAANGANPISIVVPCHRVIGADTSLTGYGGGIERKRWLLRHEGCDNIATA